MMAWECGACRRVCSEALLDCVRCGAARPHIERCILCRQPKWPQRRPGGGAETEHDWPACVNPDCEAFGEPKASAYFEAGKE
jgi:ferredoxin